MPSKQENQKVAPDTTSVRSLVVSVTKLARALNKSNGAIYRWIELNRIPARQLIHVAKFYDIDIPLHLSQSEKKLDVKIIHKPRDTLPACMDVQAGLMTPEEAEQKLGLARNTVQRIIANWGDQIPLLYDTLCKLDRKEISLDQAADILQVSKFNVHALRKKYGFRPEPRKPRKERPVVAHRAKVRQIALDAIAGLTTLADIEKNADVSWRTVQREIHRISPGITMINLTHWPKSVRQAYSYEIAHNLPKISEKLWKYSEITGIFMKKWPKYPQAPSNWRLANTRKMLIHVLLGDETLDSVAEKRGADPSVLASLFTSDLRPLNLSWAELQAAPMLTQVAVAELLMALEESKKPLRQRTIERIAEEKE